MSSGESMNYLQEPGQAIGDVERAQTACQSGFGFTDYILPDEPANPDMWLNLAAAGSHRCHALDERDSAASLLSRHVVS